MIISVIVPFYNSEQWLGRCLDSLTKQKGDFEFVLIDDQSTDKSREIAYDYCNKDNRFKLLTNQNAKGVSGARNTGMDIASGEWVTFLDADDEMLDDAYLTYRQVIDQDPRANIHQLNHLRYYTDIGKLVSKYTNGEGVYGFGNLPLVWFGVWNKLYKADFIKAIRFDQDLQYGEDGLFVLNCLRQDNYIHHADLNVVAVKHRFDNKNSLSHIKTSADIELQLNTYKTFYDEQTDALIKLELAGIIGDLYSTRLARALKEEIDK